MKESRTAIVAMSAKPLHTGHVQLINIASKENDKVILFVSLNDRKRKGEITIYGQDMEDIWREHVASALPSNVEIVYCVGPSPIKRVYEFLGNIPADDDSTYVIYSDPNDITKNYPSGSLDKYLQRLNSAGKIVLEPISRSDTTDISGTKMRKFLADGDKEQFIENLPELLQDEGERIWAQLRMSLFRK